MRRNRVEEKDTRNVQFGKENVNKRKVIGKADSKAAALASLP